MMAETKIGRIDSPSSPGRDDDGESRVVPARVDGGAASGGGTNHRGYYILLSDPDDARWLSDLQCCLRRQIEYFTATQDDVDARTRQGGLKDPIALGRVGIRCVHCAHLPAGVRTNFAVTYPKSIELVHQAVRNWQRYHLKSCPYITDAVREQTKIFSKRRKHSASSSLEHWVASCRRKGMANAEGGVGIVVLDDSGSPLLDATAGAKIKPAPDGGIADLTHRSMYAPVLETANLAEGPSRNEIEPLASFDLHEDAFDALNFDKEVEELLAEKEEEHANDVQIDDALSNLLLTAPNFCPSGGNDESSDGAVALAAAAPPTENSAREEKSETILKQTRLAYEMVRTSREMRLVPEPSASSNDTQQLVETDIRGDLVSLGVELYELFTGCRPFNMAGLADSTDTCEDYVPQQACEKRVKNRGSYTSLRELGFPVRLCILISNLTRGGVGRNSDKHTHHYQSVDQVEEDLRHMVEEPERYLFDTKTETGSGRLEFPIGKLYGRESHVSKLVEAFDRVVGPDGPSEMVLVSGYSGTGKSSLVEQVRGRFTERGGYFISGKFDLFEQAQPLSAIVAAFNEYCNILLARDAETIGQMRMAIEVALGFESKVLTDLIPNLNEVIGENQLGTIGSASLSNGSQNQLSFLFREFVRAISSPSHPLILFVDDLQWADEASLELICSILMDSDIRSLLFLGCYRDTEVGDDHPLAVYLNRFQNSGVRASEIEVGNMHRESVNSLISDTLHLSPRQTDSLTDAVFRKTSGNVLFVVQFLRSLNEEGLLHFSLSLRQWEWDIQGVQSKNIADDVVELMKCKMSRLSSEVQYGLETIACLGCQCEALILEALSRDNFCFSEESNLQRIVDIAIDDGLMFRTGSLYKFAHDEIQQAAYSLVPEHDRKALHLAIGRRLWKGVSIAELDSIIFVVTQQMNLGSGLICDQGEKSELARLNFRTGEKAALSSAFLAASAFFESGVGLLEDGGWKNHYDLSLQLYSSLAVTLYIVGKVADSSIVINEVLSHARTFEDKLDAYYTLMSSLRSQRKFQDAIETGFEVLRQLGEPFPKEVDTLIKERDFAETKSMLDTTTLEAVSHSRTMEDKTKTQAMKFLNFLSMRTYNCRPDLFGLVASRMVRLSLQDGVCKESAYGFASFGVLLCIFHGKFKEGYRMGKLALSLLERFEAKECQACVYVTVYGLINCYVEPLQASLEALLEGRRIGLLTGDPAYAVSNSYMYLNLSIQCGRPLEPLNKEMKAHLQEMSEYKQGVVLALTQPLHQFVLNLMGCSEDPVTLTGDAMDQEAFLWETLETQDQNARFRVYFMRLWLAYLFGRYDLVREMAEECINSEQDRGTVGTQMSTFYVGLASLALARLSEKDKWVQIAQNYLENMTVLAESSAWNYQHKLDLMNAEFYFLLGDNEKAEKSYTTAIELAKAHRFIHERALAHERAALFYSETGDDSSQKDHYRKARQCYLEWGATRKASDLEPLCF